MAKKKAEVKEYLYGTFGGAKGMLTIDATTDLKEVEKFLKDNPALKDMLTNSDRIAAQRALMKKGK